MVGKDRRRYPRVGVELEVSLDLSGIRWQGKTVDLSPYGVRVTLPPNPVTLPPGTRVELRLAFPGGDSPLLLTASVVRVDPNGVALNFLDQGALAFSRLKGLVDSLLHDLSSSPARLDVSVRSLKDRRRAPRTDAELDIDLDGEMPRCWQGKYKTINLSTIGVKVAWPATGGQPPWGTGVQLRLAEPGGQPPIRVTGIVWRREPTSLTFLFVELAHAQVERLKAVVESLRASPINSRRALPSLSTVAP